MRRVLFVCTGNLCRSPMAQGMLERALRARDLHWLVDSAGIHAQPGTPPPPLAIEVARGYGADIAGWRARRFSIDDFRRYDHIIALARDHLAFLRATCPEDFNGDIRLLPARGGELDVPDPFGCGVRQYQHVARLIAAGIEAWLTQPGVGLDTR